VRKPSFTGQFKKDRKRAAKRGRDVAHLDDVLRRLIADDTLEPRYRAHPLRGQYAGHWECHIEPDFLLIWYYAEGDEIVFVRTGTHADLFDE
jgi:mRNA interferase YafQ